MATVHHRLRLITVLLGTFALLAALAPTTTMAQADQRCFSETSHCISGRIREFWEQNGGLPVFGLPLGPQQEETIEDKAIQVQWFERNRLELHPENARPYDVLLGRLGADRLAQQGRDWFTFPKGAQQDGCVFFTESGHGVCEPFLSAWRANGLELDGARGKTQAESMALFGLPLSEPQTERLSDGKEYTVQWFERARFELHPENQPPFNVLLGLLGSEVRPGQTTPAPAPAPTQFDGYWDGRAPEDARVTFTVSRGRVIFTQIDVRCGSDSSSFSSRQSTPISDGAFQVMNSIFNFSGAFADGGASGTLQITSPDISCGGLLSGAWSAKFGGPAPLDGFWKGQMGNAAEISFYVNRGLVSDVKLSTPGCGVMSGVTLGEEYRIDKNSFYAGGSGGRVGVSGTFSSDTSAAGNVEYNIGTCSYAGPWTATKQ